MPGHASPCPALPRRAPLSGMIAPWTRTKECATRNPLPSLAEPRLAEPGHAQPRLAKPGHALPRLATPSSPFRDESGGELNPTQRRPFRFPCQAVPSRALPRLAMPCLASPCRAGPRHAPLSGINQPWACTTVPLDWSISAFTLLAAKTKTVHCVAVLGTIGAWVAHILINRGGWFWPNSQLLTHDLDGFRSVKQEPDAWPGHV